ncbi:hypothetical protein [Kibdelosporangium persicum]|uniref:hypothetical protein n=1 Tax=Kibdelosporangium persicum TaxID=2698649 RepID=UPI00156785B7|nr:hypothetical protein [Kibdelosporangium persicum]
MVDVFMSAEQIYRNFTEARGGEGLAGAAAIVKQLVKEYEDQADQIIKLAGKMESAWQGDAAGAAQRGAGPLAMAHAQAAPEINTAQDLSMRQVGSFGDAKNAVRPVPPEPTFPDPWMMVTSPDAGATYKGQIAAYNAASQHNVDVMSAYDDASSYNTTRLPSSYGSLMADNAAMNVASLTDGPVPPPPPGVGGGDRPSPLGRAGGGPGPGTGNPGTANPGTGNPGTGNPGTGNPGDGPVALPPSGPGQVIPPPQQGTDPGSFVPPSPGGPGGGSGGLIQPGNVPVTGGNSGGFSPVGILGPTGAGPGGGSNGPGAGSGPGAGGGRTGGGLPGVGGQPNTGGQQPFAGRGGIGPVTPGEGGAVARGAGARGGPGAMPIGGIGAARGQGGEDEEHKRASFLQEPDPEAIFGTDERTAPPVIE